MPGAPGVLASILKAKSHGWEFMWIFAWSKMAIDLETNSLELHFEEKGKSLTSAVAMGLEETRYLA